MKFGLKSNHFLSERCITDMKIEKKEAKKKSESIKKIKLKQQIFRT